MNKKRNPRVEYLQVRITTHEKQLLKEEAIEKNIPFATLVRSKLGFREYNE